MAKDAIVFACANPVPEIWPWEAKQAGARIVASGRSDFPNQVNNSLGFPAIFRGVIDVAASTITDEMCIADGEELARCAETSMCAAPPRRFDFDRARTRPSSSRAPVMDRLMRITRPPRQSPRSGVHWCPGPESNQHGLAAEGF